MNNNLKSVVNNIQQQKMFNFTRRVDELNNKTYQSKKVVPMNENNKSPENLFRNSSLLKGNNKFFKK